MLKKKPLAYDGMDGRASFQCGGVFKGFCLFSNDWKLLLKKFQSLETFLTIFPIIGKTPFQSPGPAFSPFYSVLIFNR
ncbi:MAG: hypothetical protein PHG65_03695 [Kiritimatiellae bacterium]|nr:hypothetical protein [Kiritimatiellia bacterium]